jgi:hypothetical protein
MQRGSLHKGKPYKRDNHEEGKSKWSENHTKGKPQLGNPFRWETRAVGKPRIGKNHIEGKTTQNVISCTMTHHNPICPCFFPSFELPKSMLPFWLAAFPWPLLDLKKMSIMLIFATKQICMRHFFTMIVHCPVLTLFDEATDRKKPHIDPP